jgi:DNA-directed RNA polymerase subunit RPC12/RpoP
VQYSSAERVALVTALREREPSCPLECPRCGHIIYPPPIPLSNGDLPVRCKVCHARTLLTGREYGQASL